jgi:hypothetical protein
VSWDRTTAAKALYAVISEAAAEAGSTAVVYDRPPYSLNPPAIVVGRPVEVRFGQVASTIDEAEMPVACVGPVDGDEMVSDLIALVRSAVGHSSQLGGAVQVAFPAMERNWRPINVGGTDLLSADVVITIQM